MNTKPFPSVTAHLPNGVVVTGVEVTGITRNSSGFLVHARNRASISTRAVLLATPAHVASPLTAGLDAELAGRCGGIRFASPPRCRSIPTPASVRTRRRVRTYEIGDAGITCDAFHPMRRI